MTKSPQPIDEAELREQLAAIEHQRWADWQKWLHGKLTRHNGVKGQCKPGMLMSPSDYQHWEEQIAADYSELSEAERNSDREQVDRYWPLIEAYVAQAVTAALKRADDGLPEEPSKKLPEAVLSDYGIGREEVIDQAHQAIANELSKGEEAE